MGRTCATCGRERPHEAFGGKGERARICRDCRRMPIWCHRDASSRAHSKVALFGAKTRWHFCWRQSSVVLRRSASRSCGDICWCQNSVSRKYQHVPTIFRLRAAKQRRHFFLASGPVDGLELVVLVLAGWSRQEASGRPFQDVAISGPARNGANAGSGSRLRRSHSFRTTA